MKTYLLLGSNLGNREQNLLLAKNFIINNIGEIMAESDIYETEPWKMHNENKWFLNQVVLVETQFLPNDILEKIKKYEKLSGRKSLPDKKSYDNRVIDIDILFYENQIINTKQLIIPHPLLHTRRFVLVPLNDIAPEFIHPVMDKSIQELLKDCKDKSKIKEYYSIEIETTN